MIIGLTGQTGTGKSTLAEAFSKKGFLVFDADYEYKLLLENNLEMQKKIKEVFKSLDRKTILQSVSKDKKLLNELNKISHYYVRLKLDEFIENNPDKNIVLDVPIPVEEGFMDRCDLIIVTVCNKDIQIKRLLERYKTTKEEIIERINLQDSYDFYIKKGDIIINTDKTDMKDLNSIVSVINNTYI